MAIDPIRAEELSVNPSHRVPVALCLDVSGSMAGPPITELNEGVRLFINSVREDPIASASAELCIVTFAKEAKLVADFRELTYFQFDRLTTPAGPTNLGAGVNLALDYLEKCKTEYKHVGIEHYQPWLVLMTDGVPNVGNHIDAAERVCRLEAERRLVVFPIGIGNEADMAALAKFSKKRPPLKLKGLNFQLFFDWLSKSVSQVSQSIPGDEVKIDTDGIQGWGVL